MKKVKTITIKIIVIYVILYVALGSTCSVFATRGYDDACRRVFGKICSRFL